MAVLLLSWLDESELEVVASVPSQEVWDSWSWGFQSDSWNDDAGEDNRRELNNEQPPLTDSKNKENIPPAHAEINHRRSRINHQQQNQPPAQGRLVATAKVMSIDLVNNFSPFLSG